MNLSLLTFKENKELTVGVELELQLVNLYNWDLAMEAKDLLRRLADCSHPGDIKPEITQSMIEINSSIHANHTSLIAELCAIRDVLAQEALRTHIGICGGGTHPFQKWKQQRIFPTRHFASRSEQYGYLAKQFTVFGQHIHLGCRSGDDALYLCHAFARYIPHFLALSASSPFYQGVDTMFDCSRLNVINTFPLSGTPPWVHAWEDFTAYFIQMNDLGIVQTMKDFYWDIRPKPEYGTVELRICDTPLTVEKAAALAAYAQTLASWLLEERPYVSREIYLTYLINRFRATRYGLEAEIVDPQNQIKFLLADDILATCEKIISHAALFDSHSAIEQIKKNVMLHINDAALLRDIFSKEGSLSDVVRLQAKLWLNM